MLIGVIQAFLAFFSNILCRSLSEWKYDIVYDLLKKGGAGSAGLSIKKNTAVSYCISTKEKDVLGTITSSRMKYFICSLAK